MLVSFGIHYAGPGCLSASYAASYHVCHIYLCPASPEMAVAFLAEVISLAKRDVRMFLASISSRFLSF